MNNLQSVQTDNAPAAVGPYSQAIISGNLVFVSGQIPLDKNGKLLEGSLSEQTVRVLENIKAVLAAAGTNMHHIVKTTIFLTDLQHFDEVNKIYASYFDHTPPARSCVQVSALPKGAQIEVDAIAVLD